jgi:branched-chain amino acid aminotransferase
VRKGFENPILLRRSAAAESKLKNFADAPLHFIDYNSMLFLDTEGKISENPPSISMLDHGFLFGDSLYEVVRLYDRRVLAWEDHKSRLLRGAERTGLDVASILPQIEAKMRELLSVLRESSAALRMIITRGVGRLHIDWRSCDRPSVYMAAWKFDRADQPKSIRIWVANIRRNAISALDPSIKSGNYLNNVLAFKEAVENKFDDAVMLNPDGIVTELTTSNIGWAKNGKVFTPFVDSGILHGVTRKLLLEATDVEEGSYSADDLLNADEVFAISTFKEIMPVTQIGRVGQVAKTFVPGPVTERLQKDLHARILAKIATEKALF